MFASPRSNMVKLIDFGLSQKFGDDERDELMHDRVGTIYTMAPELIQGDYNEKADVWSLGVITFMLLSSSVPFYGFDRVEVIKRILQGQYHFQARRWADKSPASMQFVSMCLTQNPDFRPSVHYAKNCAWLNNSAQQGSAVHGVGEAVMRGKGIPNKANNLLQIYQSLDKIQATMQTFATYPKLKQLALMLIAYKSTTEEIGHLRDVFDEFDLRNNGEITLAEFKALYRQHYDFTDEELEHLFEGIDLDGTGVVHYIEFLAATIESHGSLDEVRLAEAFDRLDSDDSGWITVEDLRDFLGQDVPMDYLSQVIEECDIEGDHRISYDEFVALWNEDDDAKYTENCRRVLSRHSSDVSAVMSRDENNLGERNNSSRFNENADLNKLNNDNDLKEVTGTAMFRERKQLSARAWDLAPIPPNPLAYSGAC